MKTDLFWFFLVRNAQQQLEIRTVCRHCFMGIWSGFTTLSELQRNLDSHECHATPVSTPAILEVQL